MILSIIVPVYNVEKYLKRCVESLLDQKDFDDYEIILIDDGSTDSSGDICDEYASNCNRITVIHKQNGGLSSARNAGLMEAKGEYIMFVDSDDYLKSDCLGAMLIKAKVCNIDILSFNFSYVYSQYRVKINQDVLNLHDRVITGEEFLIKGLKQNKMLMMACKNVYRTTLIRENKLFFRNGYVHEDEEWTPRVFCVAEKVAQYDDSVYGYCIRNDSISNSVKNRQSSLDLIENCKLLKEFCDNIKGLELKCCLENNIITLALSAYFKARLLDKSEDVLEVISGLHADDRNKMKRALLSKSPALYLLVNLNIKRTGNMINKIRNVLYIGEKVRDASVQKIHRIAREILLCRRQRILLENHSFSILSSTCNGGVITSELGEQFRSPTVNLWLKPDDFIKMLGNLKYYMGLDVVEIQNNFCSYPVGKIADITLFFMHYHTFEEAREKWNERKQRINYDNLYIMMAEKDGCTPEMIKKFDELPYENKLIFTKNDYPEYSSAICVKECCVGDETAIMTDFVGLYKRKYDKYLDYVSWFNGISCK